MPIETAPFGRTKGGQPVTRYRLQNGAVAVDVLDYGGTIQSLVAPARDGRPVDVVLGYDTVAEYEANDGYLGALIGRWANRIPFGAFQLGGREYKVTPNTPPHLLHGGEKGFNAYVWQARQEGDRLVLSHVSPDGDEGFPGTLKVQVAYDLTPEGELTLTYDAETDKETVLNLTNHAYFNLNGGGDILGHELMIKADAFDEVDGDLIPTGRALPVANTPFDFTAAKAVGRDIEARDGQLAHGSQGYDHNFILAGRPGPAAVLHSPQTGLTLTVTTTLPGLQLYTGNMLGERAGKGGSRMGRRGALCLETQFFPKSISDPALRPVLKPGQKFRQVTGYKFTVE